MPVFAFILLLIFVSTPAFSQHFPIYGKWTERDGVCNNHLSFILSREWRSTTVYNERIISIRAVGRNYEVLLVGSTGGYFLWRYSIIDAERMELRLLEANGQPANVARPITVYRCGLRHEVGPNQGFAATSRNHSQQKWLGQARYWDAHVLGGGQFIMENMRGSISIAYMLDSNIPRPSADQEPPLSEARSVATGCLRNVLAETGRDNGTAAAAARGEPFILSDFQQGKLVACYLATGYRWK